MGRLIAVLAVGLTMTVWVGPAVAGSGGGGFWDRVSDPHREKYDKLIREAIPLLLTARQTGNRALVVRAEAILREAQAALPDEYQANFFLGDARRMLDRSAEAVASFERARQLARLPEQEAECSKILGIERSKLGRFAESLADYDRSIQLGAGDGTVYGNSAEILMALGRLGEAADRYREAVRLDSQANTPGAEHSLILAYLGLAVALDRDDQPGAAREAMAQGLQRDPTMAHLRSALEPAADVFFVPEGDVYYYLGLANEVAGRGVEAELGFRKFVAALPGNPFVRRAQQHLDALGTRGAGAAGGLAPGAAVPGTAARAPADRGAATGALRLKVVATVQSKGPADSPIIDAAWQARRPPVEPCFAAAFAAPPPAGVRVSVDVEFDPGGGVIVARARLPGAAAKMPAGLARCLEGAVKKELRVPPSARKQRTAARIELFLAPSRPSAI